MPRDTPDPTGCDPSPDTMTEPPTTTDSTDPGGSPDSDPGYRLDPRVALRPEPFGALAYHYGNRRLTFLRSTAMVDLVRELDRQPSTEAALAASAFEPGRWPTVRKALTVLERSSLLRTRDGDAAGSGATAVRTPPPGPAPQPGPASKGLTGQLASGLDAPICLTWELTYGCNLACVHCLSSSGRRDPRELTTAQAKAVVDQLAAMDVFYVNIGGGEPTIRPDFTELVEYAVGNGVGVKFSTNGGTMTPARARQLTAMDYLDVQISIDGASPATNDPVRGTGSFAAACRAMELLRDAGFGSFKVSTVVTRLNVPELDDLLALTQRFGAELRLTRLRPAGRGATTWQELHPTAEQQRRLHSWLVERPEVLTGDSFFHLSALGDSLPGLNLCGAGRVVCLIDPVGDVYACPFVMHPEFKAGSVLDPGGFATVWRESGLFTDLRRPTDGGICNACGSYDSCQGGCMAAKFFTGLPPDGPDPECVLGHGERALAELAAAGTTAVPSPGMGHSKARPVSVPVLLGRRK
jgi:mycofactocin biosynthetic radical S-adenosylmethionine protein MftC